MSARARVPVAVVLGAALSLAACGGGPAETADDAAGPVEPASAVYHVDVDGNLPDNALGKTVNSLRYFPKALQVHPGDTVVFDLRDSGDPHTVALGSYVEKAAAAAAAAEKAGGPPDAPPPAEVLAVPALLPEGPGDAIPAGAQPCYQDAGAPPLKEACAVPTGESFNGTESLVSSGWMTSEQPFTVKLGNAMAPGTYTFYCQLHGTSMKGTITVVDPATEIPTPEEVRVTAQEELEAELALLEPASAALAAATDAKPLAGALSPKTRDTYLAAFAPENVKVPVGGTVTWTLQGVHTIAVEAPADAQALRVAAPDGSVHQNMKVVAPIGGPGFAGPGGSVDGGTYEGGFRNSGLGISFPPAFSTFSLKFPKAGTFSILCGVHEGMKGTVTVG
jgi:plastocyanin